jgi:hypothetical protein
MPDPNPAIGLRRFSAWMCTPPGIVFTVVLGLGLLYMVLEHRLHLVALLPYALLLACPLMHLFHGGHGGHGGHRHRDGPGA